MKINMDKDSWTKEQGAAYERFIDCMARMVEKYGPEVIEEIENSEKTEVAA